MTFEFTEQQVAYMMQILTQRPLGEALDLFNAIQRQAQQQAQQQPRGQVVEMKDAR